jgi:hypothetical protein
MGTLHEDLCTFVMICRWILLRMRNVSDKIVEEIKTHILCPIIFFLQKSCRLWDNVEKYGRARQATDGNIIRRMRFACRIYKAAGTLRIYIIIVCARQKWLRESASVLRLYVCCLSCLFVYLTSVFSFRTLCVSVVEEAIIGLWIKLWVACGDVSLL